MQLSGIDALLIGYQALSKPERYAAALKITDAYWRDLAGDGDMAGRMIEALRRVSDRVGGEPTAGEYRREWQLLRAAGEELPRLDELVAFFGSWRRCKEALYLSTRVTPRAIEARFRRRKLGRSRVYGELQLKQALLACAAELEGPPLLAEFVWWRKREVELALARGDSGFHLPSPAPYRRCYGSWHGALLHFGFSQAAIERRLQEGVRHGGH